MKKALITGMNGFVGKYLQKALQAQGYTVAGTYLPVPGLYAMGEDYYPVDLLQPQQIAEVIQIYQPDEIYHLADAKNKYVGNIKGLEIDLNTTANLLDVVCKYKPDCKMIIIESSPEEKL